MSHLGVIAIFVISTPLARGVKSRVEWAQAGSFLFIYISKIDIQSIQMTAYLQDAQ